MMRHPRPVTDVASVGVHSAPPRTDGSDTDGAAVVATGLTKRYDGVVAVDGLDLEIATRTITALIGPNGAGKSTTIEMIAGLRRPTAGRLHVLGLDPVTDRGRLRQRVALQPQYAELLPNQTVAETLRLWASFHAAPADVVDLSDALGLADLADVRVDDLSGGQARRLLIATTLVGRPSLVLLDEPTTGLDPNARAQLWSVVEGLRDDGTTVLLSTHSMDEAEAYADEVAVLDGGVLLDVGTPVGLVARHAPEAIVRVAVTGPDEHPELEALRGVTAVRRGPRELVIETSDPAPVARRLLADDPPPDLTVRSAGLDRVFERLTRTPDGDGRATVDAAAAAGREHVAADDGRRS